MADIVSLADKVNLIADISLIRESELLLKGETITNGNSLRVHAKKDKGNWILVHDTKKVISFSYMEKGTIYTKNTILYGTEEEMKTQIENLKLIQEEE